MTTTTDSKVRTRSGVVHYGTTGSRYMVVTACGTRARQTVGIVAPTASDVTCKVCQGMAR